MDEIFCTQEYLDESPLYEARFQGVQSLQTLNLSLEILSTLQNTQQAIKNALVNKVPIVWVLEGKSERDAGVPTNLDGIAVEMSPVDLFCGSKTRLWHPYPLVDETKTPDGSRLKFFVLGIKSATTDILKVLRLAAKILRCCNPI
jgi:hypothetical protein